MSKNNSVTVFSNGMADFVRRYPAEKKTKISIPVRKNHVADVLASLNLFGDIKLDEPPSFRPENSENGTLEINPNDVVLSLAKSLSGAKVQVDLGIERLPSISGTLMGIHTDVDGIGANGLQDSRKQLIVLTDAGLQRINFSVIKNLIFTEEAVQSEIAKALQRNFQQIKPNSTFIDLSVTGTKEGAEAIVQYTIPSAAWKISYRISADERGITHFKGLAIVDNNTDEDWKEADISVVTGEPITFSTDLAESKTPSRSHINVVNDAAVGAVEVEQGYSRSLRRTKSKNMVMAACAAAPMNDGNSLQQFASGEACLESYGGSNAMQAETEIKEVGDFSIFKSSNPVTIPAQQSAVIPVFDAVLEKAKTVLHFNQSNNPNRPYRSLQFKNETSHSLGRGVCTVYQESVYSGSCVLPATKPGEDQLLPYALETGVKVMTSVHTPQSKLVHLSFKNGVCISKTSSRRQTEFTIMNSKDEQFELYVDYQKVFGPGSVCKTSQECDEETIALTENKVLSNGLRYSIDLGEKETTTLIVAEERIDSQTVQLSNHYDWIRNTFVVNGGPLANFEGMEELSKLADEIAAIKTEKNALLTRVKQATSKQERSRENLKACGKTEGLEFMEQLKACDATISTLEETEIPALDKKLAAQEKQLTTLVKKLSFTWSE